MPAPQDPSRWWGGQERDTHRLSLLDLVRNHTLDLQTAAMLWLFVERKSSLVVAAAPQLAGKTTLLTALVDFMPPRYDKVYNRGQDEDFSWLATKSPQNTYILIAELSDHTPAYLWGDAVRTLFQALARGYSVGATMHADSPREVLHLLEAAPVRVPRGLLHHLHLIVNLRLAYGARDMVRRMSKLTLVAPGPDGKPPRLATLMHWDAVSDTFVPTQSPGPLKMLTAHLRMDRSQLDEALAERMARLKAWLSAGSVGVEEVRALVSRFYEHAL